MKKVVIINAIKAVTPAVVGVLGITTIVSIIELRRQRNLAISQLCEAEVNNYTQTLLIGALVDTINEISAEKKSLEESAVSKKKKV